MINICMEQVEVFSGSVCVVCVPTHIDRWSVTDVLITQPAITETLTMTHVGVHRLDIRLDIVCHLVHKIPDQNTTPS